MKFFFTLITALSCLLFGVWRVQAMTSLNYAIPWDSVNAGGNELGASASYTLEDTIGQTAAGASVSAGYSEQSGYRIGTDGANLSFRVGAQASSPVTEYTAFMSGTKRVDVSSVTGFLVGDYIAVVENRGFNAMIVTGRIVSISGLTLEVDEWGGANPGLMSGSPLGGDDFVYRLSASSIPFGVITPGDEHTAVVGGVVRSSAENGYTVYVQGGTPLQTAGGDPITPVTDGTVSSDAEEYGAEAIGVYALSPGVDLGVTSTQRAIAQSTIPTVTADQLALLFKLSALPGTLSGTYTQTVYFTLTSNF